MVLDIGNYGGHSDSAILENSAFYREYIDGKSTLPSKPLLYLQSYYLVQASLFLTFSLVMKAVHFKLTYNKTVNQT